MLNWIDIHEIDNIADATLTLTDGSIIVLQGKKWELNGIGGVNFEDYQGTVYQVAPHAVRTLSQTAQQRDAADEHDDED